MNILFGIEMLFYFFLVLISTVIGYELSKKFSKNIAKLLSIILVSGLGTCLIIIFNNIFRYIANYDLFKHIMEWSLLDVILRDFSYSFTLSGKFAFYRYIICFLIILCLSIIALIIRSPKGRKVCGMYFWKRQVNTFVNECKRFGGFFQLALIDCTLDDTNIDKMMYLTEKLRSAVGQDLCILSSEAFAEYLESLLRYGNRNNCTSIMTRFGEGKKFIFIQDIDIVFKENLFIQKETFDMIMNEIDYDEDRVIIVGGSDVKKKAPDFYRYVERFRNGLLIE